MTTFRLTVDELGFLRQILGQVAPSPDGNVIALREKLYKPLDGEDVDLDRDDVAFLRRLLAGLTAVDDHDRPIPRPAVHARLLRKLERVVKHAS